MGCKAIVAAIAAAVIFPALAQQSTPEPQITIKELMEKTITPVTNTLWNAFEPPADEAQWVALEEAAVTLLAAGTVNGIGGSGPMDDAWAKEAAWQAFNLSMLNAGKSALEAIRARDHDALLAAGDALYPPCEGCHQLFNPGVVGQPQ